MDPRRWGRFGQRVAALTAIASALKIIYITVVKWNDPLQLNDSYYYSLQAARNFQGHWWRDLLSDMPGAEHGPLTSLYLTPWSWASYPVPYQRLAIVVLSAAVIPLVAALARRLGGQRVGLTAAVLAAVYPNLWVNDLVVMSETLAIILVAATTLLATGASAQSGRGRWIAIGAMCGLAALTRSELILMAPAFVVITFLTRQGQVGATVRRRLAAPALILSAFAVTVAPWFGYNLVRFERTTLMTTNEGTTFLGANCQRSYYADVGSWDLGCLTLRDGEEPSVRSARQRSEAFSFARSHARRIPVVIAARVGRSLDLYGVRSVVALDLAEEKIRWAVWLGVAMWWVLAALAVVGWRRLSGAGDARRWWLGVTPAGALISTVLFYGAHRLRAPMEPIVVALAALGVESLRRRPSFSYGDRRNSDHG